MLEGGQAKAGRQQHCPMEMHQLASLRAACIPQNLELRVTKVIISMRKQLTHLAINSKVWEATNRSINALNGK